eukprot:233971-Pelagomonas_calceolata.AAC.4
MPGFHWRACFGATEPQCGRDGMEPFKECNITLICNQTRNVVRHYYAVIEAYVSADTGLEECEHGSCP